MGIRSIPRTILQAHKRSLELWAIWSQHKTETSPTRTQLHGYTRSSFTWLPTLLTDYQHVFMSPCSTYSSQKATERQCATDRGCKTVTAQSRVGQLPAFPWFHPSFVAAQDTVGLLSCKGTPLTYVWLFFHQDPQVLLLRADLKFFSQTVLVSGVALTKVQHFVLGLVKSH